MKKIVAFLFATMLASSLCGTVLYAQDYKSHGMSAVSKGDYVSAVNQFNAYQAYLNSRGTDRNSEEYIEAEKLAYKASSCIDIMKEADQMFKAAQANDDLAQYQKAAAAYDKVLSIFPSDSKAARMRQICSVAIGGSSTSSPGKSSAPSASSSKATGLLINGQRNVNRKLTPDGGSIHLSLTVNSGTLAKCMVNNKSDWAFTIFDRETGDLQIEYEPNLTTAPRKSYIDVTIGSESATISISQDALINADKWFAKLQYLRDNPTRSYDGDRYKGQCDDNGAREGFGAYSVYNPEAPIYYIGDWVANKMEGRIMAIIAKDFHFSGKDDCRFFVSDYSGNVPFGQMSCYDAYGKLIYDGEVEHGTCVDEYPSDDVDHNKQFQCIPYEQGDYYVGETYKGVPQGCGMYIYSNGDIWYGYWVKGYKTDDGVMLGHDGTVI